MAVAEHGLRMIADELFERPDNRPAYRQIQAGRRVGALAYRTARFDHAPAHSRSRKSVQGRMLTPSTRRGRGSSDTIT